MVFLSSIYGVVGNDRRTHQGANLAPLDGDASDRPVRIYAHARYVAAKVADRLVKGDDCG
jgi:hypothetical protein